ncbi:xylulokinase [Histidinibacterium lentulum]|uniref:Carbohydrate kinase n=1 Tax=Histidinibacterium lentulum TaxID=2480588 RepID=A0A3N2QLN0_9RHOB|nr:FGGY-family carbohydrate kinase [Histidinibacterium lentulum]ROT96101.1 carbohydrate kinase [Histidinibacterium lentulum]
MARGEVLIGIDIGTSAVKAVMVARGGARLDAVAESCPMARPAPGAAEQDPDDWLRLVRAALERFEAHPRAGEVAAIGLTSQVNTHVFCGADLSPLRPAITWQDTRAAADGAALDARLSTGEKIAALGAPIPVDASHALARMAFVARTDLAAWTATRAVLAPKDYVIARLTGRSEADPIASIGLVGPDHRYAPAVLALLSGAEARLPPLSDPLALAGEIAEGPFAGVPVARGTMDAWASMFGLGVAREGEAMYLSGSSEVMGLISARRSGSGGVVTFPDWRGITLHAAPTQAGGGALTWASRLLGLDFAALERAAGAARLGPRSPLFLPHLEGERAPLWDAASRGAFAGLDSACGPGELALAVMEGVAFSARLALEALEDSGARRVTELAYGGGGARSEVWSRLRADTLGRSLARVAAPEAGAVGALVMAGVAAGVLPDLAEAADAFVAPDRRFAPDPARARLAEERYARFRGLYEGLAPLHHAMARGTPQTG